MLVSRDMSRGVEASYNSSFRAEDGRAHQPPPRRRKSKIRVYEKPGYEHVDSRSLPKDESKPRIRVYDVFEEEKMKASSIDSLLGNQSVEVSRSVSRGSDTGGSSVKEGMIRNAARVSGGGNYLIAEREKSRDGAHDDTKDVHYQRVNRARRGHERDYKGPQNLKRKI